MHPVDWNWSERVDCGGPISLSSPTPVPRPYFPSAAASPFPAFQPAPATSRRVPHLKPTMNASAGRKRSRDESSFADEFDSSDMSRSSASPPKHPGFARTSSGYPVDPTSSVFAEELSERLRSSSVVENGRPKMESRKSMRLSISGADGDALPTFDARGPRDVDSHDPAAMALGVGWATLSPSSASDSLAAAIRGWTAFIESRFPLSSVKFEWCKNSEPKAYLVGAVSKIGRSPGYYLFQEDLQQGRLVAKSWGNALDHLRTGLWEGAEMLSARDPTAVDVEVRGMEMGVAEPYMQAVGTSTETTNAAQEVAMSDVEAAAPVNGVQHMGHPLPVAAPAPTNSAMDLD